MLTIVICSLQFTASNITGSNGCRNAAALAAGEVDRIIICPPFSFLVRGYIDIVDVKNRTEQILAAAVFWKLEIESKVDLVGKFF